MESPTAIIPGTLFDELAELTFTLTERLLRALSLIDIGLQTHQRTMRLSASRIREPLHVEPPVSAVRAPLPMFIGERLAAVRLSAAMQIARAEGHRDELRLCWSTPSALRPSLPKYSRIGRLTISSAPSGVITARGAEMPSTI